MPADSDTLVCLSCGAQASHPSLIDCVQFLRGRLDVSSVALTAAVEDKNAAEERWQQCCINLDWLKARVAEAHAILCPEFCGSWQQQAQQLIAYAKRVTLTSTKSEPR